VRHGNNPKYPPMNEWIKKMWHIKKKYLGILEGKMYSVRYEPIFRNRHFMTSAEGPRFVVL